MWASAVLPRARLLRDADAVGFFARVFRFALETLLPASSGAASFLLAFKGSVERTRRSNCFTRLSETPMSFAVLSTVGYGPVRITLLGFMQPLRSILHRCGASFYRHPLLPRCVDTNITRLAQLTCRGRFTRLRQVEESLPAFFHSPSDECTAQNQRPEVQTMNPGSRRDNLSPKSDVRFLITDGRISELRTLTSRLIIIPFCTQPVVAYEHWHRRVRLI